MQRVPWDWPAGSVCSFPSPSSTPTSPPVPKARGILQRQHLLKLSQLSSLCVSYLLNADASSSVISLRHLTVKYCYQQENSLSWERSPRGGVRRMTGGGGNADHAHTRLRWPELVAPLGLPGFSNSKESACNAGDLGSIPGSGRSPGGRNGNPLQYPCLQNPMD